MELLRLSEVVFVVCQRFSSGCDADALTDIPVSVLTIRDQAHNGDCDSVNPEYFDNFYELQPSEFRTPTLPLANLV